MSAPVPASGKEDVSGNRRVSTGDMLDLADRRVSRSPLVLDEPVTAPPGQSSDEDFNRRMRNMALVPEPAPPQRRPPPSNEYSSYTGPVHSYAPFHQQPMYSPMAPAFPQFPSQPAFYDPASGDYPLDTIHGMAGYPVQVPAQSPSPSAYSMAPHPSTTPRPYGWGSPPMSPAMSSVPFGMVPGAGRLEQGGMTGQGMDGYGSAHGMMMYGSSNSRGQWTPAPASPFAYYAPYQQTMDAPPVPPSPSMPQTFQHRGSWTGPQHRPPYPNTPNRMSWSGPTVGDSQRERERKAYHPQPPARRSDWVMWVGNVPSNTSHEELWRYFNNNAPSLPGDPDNIEWHGPSSIFLISRSQCAFVNLSCQTDLDRAVEYFNGKSLRPQDPKCPRMVCRVRRKDDDLKAGVGAQRGTGMHREWIRAQGTTDPKVPPLVDTSLIPPPSESALGSAKSLEPPSPAVLEHPPEGEGRRRESIINVTQAQHQSSASMASTNSSFLVRHFPKRYFILKSLTTVELEDSVTSGTWKTQRHNEPILDQAFRTAQEVILIFSANKSGEFFGYAKMIEPIDKEKAAARAAQAAQRPGRLGTHSPGSTSLSAGSAGSGSLPLAKSTPQSEPITEEDETEGIPQRPKWLQSQSSQRFAASSPGQLTPHDLDSEADELDHHRRGERKTESPQPVGMGSLEAKSNASAPAWSQRAQTLSPGVLPGSAVRPTEEEPQSFFDLPIPQASRQDAADKQEALGGSSKPPNIDVDGILRKDTMLTPGEKAEREDQHPAALSTPGFAPDDWGMPFRIEWVRVGALPFHRIRNLRNPWNADREIKVSRDGTEVEPGTAAMLLGEWDRLNYRSTFPSFPEHH